MMFLWLPFLFLVPLAMFWMMRSGNGDGVGVGCCGMSHVGHGQGDTTGQSPSGPDPTEIARQRLARGEITTSEYEEIRRLVG
jgi:hypothetical protein